MISAEEAKKITLESRKILQRQDAERIHKFLETLSKRIEEQAMKGSFILRVEFPEWLCCFYSPSQVKSILTKSLASCGFYIDDTTTESNCAFRISWD